MKSKKKSFLQALSDRWKLLDRKALCRNGCGREIDLNRDDYVVIHEQGGHEAYMHTWCWAEGI